MTVLDSTSIIAPDGTKIHRWERVPANATEAVVFIHGATYGGRSAFAPSGYSWLDAIAATGRAAYAADIRGYGNSEHQSGRRTATDQNLPAVRASRAARDVAIAIEGVYEMYDAVHLVGYSWGTMVSGLMLTDLDIDVTSLVQYAPVYHPAEDRRDQLTHDAHPAGFRRISKADTWERWANQRPEQSVPDDAFEAFWETLTSSEQRSTDTEIYAPNGALTDIAEAIDAPLYDAAKIDIPTLVIRGSLDTSSTRMDALTLYEALGGANRVYTEIAGGTHFLQLEPKRKTLYDTVQSFYEQSQETE